MNADEKVMRAALGLARRGYGLTSPNPMVGAVLVKAGKMIGRGWHRRTGEPHAEIEALRDAERRGYNAKGTIMYVTLEPCSTHGRTPPCTQAIEAAGVRRVIIGATDPNPKHRGKGFALLRRAGIEVTTGVLEEECEKLNEAFNHWIVHRTPFVTVKAAMTMDGKIATPDGESKWITGAKARAYGMELRHGADAVLVGIETVLADDPRLTVRRGAWRVGALERGVSDGRKFRKGLRRIVLDGRARTPLEAQVVSDEFRELTTVVVGRNAPEARVRALEKRVRVISAPVRQGKTDLNWLLRRLGEEEVTSLLVEGGGEVNASFLLGGFAQKVAFFYAPIILGGRNAKKAVAGQGVRRPEEMVDLEEVEWRRIGEDWLLEARVKAPQLLDSSG